MGKPLTKGRSLFSCKYSCFSTIKCKIQVLGGLAISVCYKRYQYLKKSPSLAVVNCYKAAKLATKVSLYSHCTNVL